MRITRLAPSPTGALHLGNARTFLINWLMARQKGWKCILRIEDLDGPRVKRHADRELIDDLAWLGMDWDDGPIYQSQRADIYRGALDELIFKRLAYFCTCTRREAEVASSAPHLDDGSAVYPGTCRGRFASREEAKARTGREAAVRFHVPPRIVEFDDAFAGRQRVDVGALGDFVIAKGDGTAAYHLAVVVDDAAAGVTDIIRGDDLLESAARQFLIYEALGLASKIPTWRHLPLVIGADGRRLAKRHGDTRLAHYRAANVSAGRMLALLGRWCGMETGTEATLKELVARFDINSVPREPIIFGAVEDAWLLGQSIA